MKFYLQPRWLHQWLAALSERPHRPSADPSATPPREAFDDYDRVFERVSAHCRRNEERLALESSLARCLAAELADMTEPERSRVASSDPRYHSWSVAEMLIERVDGLADDDTEAAEQVLALAGRVLDHLAPPRVPRELVADLRGRRLAYHGDLLRRRGELDAAAAALEAARVELLAGSGDPLERARRLERTARLHHERGEVPSALRIAGRAAALFAAVEQPDAASRVRLLRADLFRAVGRGAEEATELERAFASSREAREDAWQSRSTGRAPSSRVEGAPRERAS